MIPPDVQSEILALHFGNKMGTRAIAKRLGISRKAVRWKRRSSRGPISPVCRGTGARFSQSWRGPLYNVSVVSPDRFLLTA